MLRENLRYKILAVVLAISLWLYVAIVQRQAAEVQRSFPAQVELRNADAKYAVTVDPERVRMVLRGRPDALESPSPAPAAYVNLRGIRPGEHTVQVGDVTPEGTRLVRVEPSTIRLTVEPIISKTMTVEAKVWGAAPPGYLLGEPQITPATVTVSGVKDAVARVSHVVVNVDARYALPDTPQTKPLRAVDDAGEAVEGAQLSHTQARVVIPVQRTLSYQTVPVVLHTEGAPASGYRISRVTLRPPVVTIAGDAERLRQVGNLRTTALDLDGAQHDISRVVRLVLPDRVTTVSEAQVQVNINIEPERGGTGAAGRAGEPRG